MVRWLKPRVAIVLLTLWAAQPSWLLGLLAIAEGSHAVSVRESHGDLDLVLHHHDVADAATREVAFQADDHPHGDHVIRGSHDEMLASRPGWLGGAPAIVVGLPDIGVASHAAAPCTRLLIGAFGPAPPQRSVVLRI